MPIVAFRLRLIAMHYQIAVVGTNYVGLVTAACLAQLGHTVVGIDVDPLKVARLERGQLPIVEQTWKASCGNRSPLGN